MHPLVRHVGSVALLFLGLATSATASADDTPASKTPGFTARSVKSGPWSSAETWAGKKVPVAGDRVLVSRGTEVRFDVESPVIRYLQVAGTLSFSRDRNTTLNVGILTIQSTDEYAETGFDCHAAADKHDETATPGARAALEVGMPDNPIPHPIVARIRLHYLDGMKKEDGPAIVCCGGRMDLHGTPMNRTWLELNKTAKPGDTTLVAEAAPSGWRVGDELLVTGAKRKTGFRKIRENPDDASSEVRRIAKIDGANIQLDKPLANEHLGEGEFRSEVANLSRNVVVESADPNGVRGHTMYHAHSAGGISYARFAHLGKEGVLGRYPIHYHLAGTSMRGSSVVGVSVVDSHNRWVTIHGTQYLVVRDCVGYRSVGHGYFLEDATEVYNLLDRNLGVQAFHGKRLPKQVLPFDQNDGAAFWWANGRNSLTRNSASENDIYGYRFDIQKSSSFDTNLPILMPDGTKKKVDVRTVPIFLFDTNESHTEGLAGMVVAANGDSQIDDVIRDHKLLNQIKAVDWTAPDTKHPHVIRNLTIWHAHYAFRPHSPSMLMENIRIHDVAYGIYRPAFDNQVYKNINMSQAGGEPFNRGMDDAACQVGKITVDGLKFSNEDGRGGNQLHPLVHMSDLDLSGHAESHFRNVVFDPKQKRPVFNRGGSTRVDPIIDQGVPYYVHDYFGPGRHAKIASTKAPNLMNDGSKYRSLPPLTGDESVVAEVSDVAWPKLLDPVDDLPPATIVLSVKRNGDKLTVRGVSHDNGKIRSVTVNDRSATMTAIQAGLVDWSVELPAPKDGVITATATDDAGNREATGHRVTVNRE